MSLVSSKAISHIKQYRCRNSEPQGVTDAVEESWGCTKKLELAPTLGRQAEQGGELKKDRNLCAIFCSGSLTNSLGAPGDPLAGSLSTELTEHDKLLSSGHLSL